ncbi:hypothetical protein Tco_1131185 [Tanacetum coccineum]
MSTKAVDNMDIEVAHPKIGTESKPMASEVVQPQSDLFSDKIEVGVTGNMDSEVAQPKTATESKPVASEVARPETDLFFDKLEVGVTGTIVVMLCRMWDVSTVTGHYLCTDFIVSDVKPNKDEYRVMKDDALSDA